METPEKIYLQVCGDCNANDCDNCKFEDLEDNVTWWKDKIFDDDIEYIRKDAFIKKACEWLKSNLYDYAGEDDKRNIVPFDDAVYEDFRKAMEE